MQTTRDARHILELQRKFAAERQLRLQAQQRAASLASVNARLNAAVLRYKAAEAEAAAAKDESVG
jgi:hypothetical protein